MSYKFSEFRIADVKLDGAASKCKIVGDCIQHVIASLEYDISFGLSADQLRESVKTAQPKIRIAASSPNSVSAHFMRAVEQAFPGNHQFVFQALIKHVIKQASIAPDDAARAPQWLIETAVTTAQLDVSVYTRNVSDLQKSLSEAESKLEENKIAIRNLTDLKKALLDRKQLAAKLISQAEGKWIIDQIHNGVERTDLIAYAPLSATAGVYVKIGDDAVMNFGQYAELLDDRITDAVFDKPLRRVACSDFETALDIAIAKFKLNVQRD